MVKLILKSDYKTKLVQSWIIFDYLSCHFSVCPPQTRQPVFVQLLQAVFRVYHCNWLVPVQKGSVENCIKVLSDVGKIMSLLLSPSLQCFYCCFFNS